MYAVSILGAMSILFSISRERCVYSLKPSELVHVFAFREFWKTLASNPGFSFRTLSHSFGGSYIYKTKKGKLGTLRLGRHPARQSTKMFRGCIWMRLAWESEVFMTKLCKMLGKVNVICDIPILYFTCGMEK